MNAYPKFGEPRHGAADIHDVATEAIELGDRPARRRTRVDRGGARTRAAGRWRRSRNYLGDHTPGLDLEARRLDLLQLNWLSCWPVVETRR